MKPYQALIWNEWRQMRGNVMALAGVTVLLWLLLLAASFNKSFVEYIEMIATALAIGLPLLYSAMLADSFAKECSQKTDSFLLELPVTPAKIFLCKYLANLCAFFILILLESQIMIHLTCVTSGKHFTDEFSPGDWIIKSGIIVSSWILGHAMVFVTSLLCKKPGNSITGIIIMPLLYVLMLPGTMAVTMFFIQDDNLWIISSLLLAFIILYCLCLVFGWYLWTRRIACGKRILKPVIAVLAVILIAPWILYGMAYLIVWTELKMELVAAGKNNLILDIRQVLLPPVPDDQNAVPEIVNFANNYSKQLESSKLDSISGWSAYWNETEFRKKQDDKLPIKATLETAKYLLLNPEINKCYLTLDAALKKPFYQNGFKPEGNYDKYYSNAAASRTAACFLYNRAHALQLMQREDEMFECLKKIDIIADKLAKEPLANSHFVEMLLRRLKYEAAIATGTDALSSTKYYNEMIKEIDVINFTYPDDTYIVFAKQDSDIDAYIDSSSLARQFVKACCRLYSPRQLYYKAVWVQWHIQHQKLLRLAQAGKTFWEIEKDFYLMLRKGDIPLINANTCEAIRPYFVYRASFDTYKICLALKIYKARHGRFPDSLQQLVPEILLKIPCGPWDGKDYVYKPEDNGFILKGNYEAENFSGLYDIKYRPWDIKPEKIK